MVSNLNNFDKNLFFNETYIYAFYCNTKKCAYHNHNFFELVYVVSGKGIHKIDNEVHEISEGDYMFMDYSTFHEYEAVSDDFAVINCLFLANIV